MTPALSIQDLRKSFGATAIIKGITVDIAAGERHAVIGPNGAGKSTFFHLVSGRYVPDGGQILLHGEDITGLPAARDQPPRPVALVPGDVPVPAHDGVREPAQRRDALDGRRLHVLAHDGGFGPLNARAEEMLELTGLAPRRNVLAGALAYADQRALEIGVAVASGAGTVLLDEPTAGMSHAETDRAVALIRRVTEGKTLVMIEHDLGVVFDLADRITVLADGQVIASGPPAEVRGNPAVRTAYLGTAADALSVRTLC